MIEFREVAKGFAGVPVLRGLSFRVEPGEVYGLLGPNGCGKSTAINLLSGLLDPDQGHVLVAGRPADASARRAIGAAPQEIALYRDLTCAENLRFFGEIHGVPRERLALRVQELLDIFALSRFPTSPADALSGGWQRRLNLAAALVHSPSILVLDEPTAAVDIAARHELWQLIEQLRGQGMALLLTTHHLDEAERLCSRIGIMQDGKILAEGTAEELLRRVAAAQVALVEARDEARVETRAAALGWPTRRYAGRLGLLQPELLSLRQTVDALEGADITSLSLQPVRLEHAYLEILGEAAPAKVS
jgi:ABC-2 type transport system ATP-binding protein